MTRAFDHIWTWPVDREKAAELQGLTGKERQARIEELCREEVAKTLKAIRVEFQAKLDQRLERRHLQPEGDR
jgi:hypothetical protein